MKMYYTPEEISKAIADLNKRICCNPLTSINLDLINSYDNAGDAVADGLQPGDLYYTVDGGEAFIKIVLA